MHNQVKLRTTLPQVKITGFFVQKEKETPTSRLKGVDEGLTSLFLQCLRIETVPIHHQQSLFESIPTVIMGITFSSSSHKYLHKQKFEQEVYIYF
jgi:hypothetical protein